MSSVTAKLACTVVVAGTALFGVVGLVACTGGGGPLMDSWNGWDYDKGQVSQREAPVNGQDASLATDPAKNSREVPPNRGLDPEPQSILGCSGKYDCVVTGTTRTCIGSSGNTTCTQGSTVTLKIEIALSREDGQCTLGKVILNPNGTFKGTDKESPDGTWIPYGDGFKLTAGDTTALCTRSAPFGPFDNGSGHTTLTTSSSSSSSSSSGTGDIPAGDGGF